MFPQIIKKTVILFFLFFGPLSIQAESIFNHLNEADHLFENQNYNRALFHYKNALEFNPSSLKALLGNARCAMKIQSYPEALQSYQKILKLEPDHMEAIAGIAKITAISGDSKKGLKLISKNLKKHPYNQHLLITRIEIYLIQEDYFRALRALNEAKGKVVRSNDFEILNAKTNIAAGNYQKGKKILKRLTGKDPENPDLFRELAKANFSEAIHIFPSTDVEKLMETAQSYLLISLALNRDSDETRLLLIRCFIWFQEYEKAQQQCEDLLREQAENAELYYIHSYLAQKLNQPSLATQSYANLLRNNDLDEIGRYSAEQFSMQKLSENHWFRNNLGKYRLIRNQTDRNSDKYGQAGYNLMLSYRLIPDNRLLRKYLYQYYYRNGYLKEMINLLKKIRNDEPRNIKVHNKLERALRYRKNSLSYREGYSTINGELVSGIRNIPKLFLFDLKPNNFISNHPDAPLIITRSLKFALQLMPNVSLLPDSVENRIKAKIRASKPEYKRTQGVYYSPDILNTINLDTGRRFKNHIRYVGYGDFSQIDTELQINFELYDRNEGTILKKIRFTSHSQNYLSELSMHLAKSISSIIPRTGRILKIKSNSVLINMGYRDGIRLKQVYRITRKGKTIGNVCIKSMDEFLSLAIPTGKPWSTKVNSQDKIQPETKKIKQNACK